MGNIDVVRIWIGHPYEDGNFNGTAFFIDANTLVTAKHVIVDRNNTVYNNIFISDTDDGGILPVVETILCQRDLAILKVKKPFKIQRIDFTKEVHRTDVVQVFGFYDKNTSQKSYENRVSGYLNNEHTYELQNHLTKGLSGSPIILNKKVCGVATAINSTKNITYMIPITELCIELDFSDTDNGDNSKIETQFSLSNLGKISAIVASLTASYVAVASLSQDETTIYKEQQLNHIPYICYETRHIIGTHKVYEGCSEEKVSCNLLSKEHFGKYPTVEEREIAFHACKNSTLNHNLGKYVCYISKRYIQEKPIYSGCTIEVKPCSNIGKIKFGRYPLLSERDDALKRCEDSRPKN